MAYNVNEIIGRVKDRLDDSEYPQAVLINFLNDTQQEIFNQYEIPFNQTSFVGVLAEGQYKFNFVDTADDYQRVVSLRLTDPDKEETDISENFLNYKDFRKRYPKPEDNSAGKPSDWTTYGFQIIFSKPTDQEYTMAMDYLKEATILENTDEVPELPASWQEVLVLGTYIRALERNDDNDIAEYHRTKQGGYLDSVQTLINRYNPGQTASTTIMRQSRNKRRV